MKLEAVGEAELALEIVLPQGTVSFDADSLASAAGQAEGAPITLSLERLHIPDIPQDQRRHVRGSDVILSINVSTGDNAITRFDGTITVTVPYDGPLPAAVWFLDGDGILHRRAATYCPETRTVSFATDHFSYFIIGEAPPSFMLAAALPGLGGVAQPIIVENEQTYIAIRAFVHMLMPDVDDPNQYVDWNSATRSAAIAAQCPDTGVWTAVTHIRDNNPNVFVNGIPTVLPVMPRSFGGRFMLPLDVMGRLFGYELTVEGDYVRIGW